MSNNRNNNKLKESMKKNQKKTTDNIEKMKKEIEDFEQRYWLYIYHYLIFVICFLSFRSKNQIKSQDTQISDLLFKAQIREKELESTLNKMVIYIRKIQCDINSFLFAKTYFMMNYVN